MNISRLNLNLLTALDALLSEKNVTKAGNKMFITQSAMSNVLKQLREVFQDELLIPEGRHFRLSLKAKSLVPQIKQLLSQAEAIFNPKPFDPENSDRTFTLALEEYSGVLILPDLYAYLSEHAPNVKLKTINLPMFAEESLLASQEIDLAIGLLKTKYEVHQLSHELLFREKLVCIGREKHPLFKKTLTRENYLKAKHVSLLLKEDKSPFIVDKLLGSMAYKRNVVLYSSQIVPALYTIAKSDVIATVPEGIGKEAKRIFNLSVADCPFPTPELAFVQIWHPWTEIDSACQWLRKVVASLSKKLSLK